MCYYKYKILTSKGVYFVMQRKMACDLLIWGLLMFGCSIQALLVASEDDPLEYMSKEEREALKFV